MFPFSSLKKRMSTIVRLDDGKFRLFVKGAPEFLLPLCKSELVNDKPEPLTQDRKVQASPLVVRLGLDVCAGCSCEGSH